jgi:hypothetical protein
MKPDGSRKLLRLIEIKGAHHFLHVPTQFFPSIAFSHNAVGQALGAKSPVRFLDNCKDEFVHFGRLGSAPPILKHWLNFAGLRPSIFPVDKAGL